MSKNNGSVQLEKLSGVSSSNLYIKRGRNLAMMFEGNSLVIQIPHLRGTLQIRKHREIVHKLCAAINLHTLVISANFHKHLYAVMKRQ